MDTTIKFNQNYLKLHNQTSAELVAVKLVDLALMSNKDFNDLYEYDCKSDIGYYPLNQNKTYTQLIFVGNKHIPFTTLRNKTKYIDYYKMIGCVFNIEVENVI